MLAPLRVSIISLVVGAVMLGCVVNVEKNTGDAAAGGPSDSGGALNVGGTTSAGGSLATGGTTVNSNTGGSSVVSSIGGSSVTGAGGSIVSSNTGGTTVVSGVGGSSAMPGTGGSSVKLGTGGSIVASGTGGTKTTSSTGGSTAILGIGGSSVVSGTGGWTASDPCLGVTTYGVCVGNNQVTRCAVPTGNGVPQLVTESCGSSAQCTVVGGVALCLPLPGKCISGEQACATTTRIRICDTSGAWQEQDCPSTCSSSALGAFCDSTSTGAYAGTIKYEARGLNALMTDWGTSIVTAPGVGILIVSSRNGQVVDAQVADSTGSFTIQLPKTWQTGDQLTAMLVSPNETKTGYAFAVAQPDVADGMVGYLAPPGANPQLWLWSIDPLATPSGSTVVITEALGSGAVRVFDYLRYSYAVAYNYFGKAGKPLVVWMRNNTSWSCGACFVERLVSIQSMQFQSQFVLPATSQDQSYWADPKTAHELGHWVMASFGTSPNEGGQHCIGETTWPGQAWSEGWATGFSSIVRNNGIFYDKQNGSMFWLDLDAHQYSGVTAWQRPTPSGGLLQYMDENEVAAMLWSLNGRTDVGANVLFTALGSTRMTTSPFARQYTRHTWSMTAQCERGAAVDTYESAPMVADFMDALRCSGIPAAAIDAVANPTTYYPYPSNSPLCP